MSRVGLARDASWWRAICIASLAYLAAIAAAAAVVALTPTADPWWAAVQADVVATVVVFGFSVATRNSSMYDPYWSVAPMVMVGWWWLHPSLHPETTRALLAVIAVQLWGLRLTANWVRGWGGLGHEDWRYLEFKAKTRALWWPFSLVGIHLFPTVQVLVGCIGLYAALSMPAPLGALDWIGFAVALFGAGLELVADEQLRSWRRSPRKASPVIDVGLWRWTRHPNYLGEILFWVGLWLLGLGAGAPWWSVAGPLVMIALFRFYSIPAMEARILRTRPAYARCLESVPMLLPRPPRA
jgi:steroid 5-alpha reductase family enzyme